MRFEPANARFFVTEVQPCLTVCLQAGRDWTDDCDDDNDDVSDNDDVCGFYGCLIVTLLPVVTAVTDSCAVDACDTVNALMSVSHDDNSRDILTVKVFITNTSYSYA